MNKIVLCIGSNSEDRTNNVKLGLDIISTVLCNLQESRIYETPPVKGRGNSYANAVIKGDTLSGYEELVEFTKRQELIFGRDEQARLRGEVPIDIDIVIWNDVILRPRDFKQSFFKMGYNELTQ